MQDSTFVPAPCPPQYLGAYGSRIGRQTSNRRDFFDAVGKIGNLEVLNDIGASSIGRGLRTLAGISDTLRTGCGQLPTSIGGGLAGILDQVGAAAEQGVNWVFDSLGLDINMVDAVRSFDPNVANLAYAEATQLYERLKAGNLKLEDLPSYLQSFQNLERMARQIYTPKVAANKIRMACEASPYAIDLVRRHGKYQFLFVVEFVFNPAFVELSQLSFPFVVKKGTRPNVRFVTDDVNYYNFRSKYYTRTEYEDMSMTFHDDQQNQSMRFYNAYLRATSPIANVGSATELFDAEERGMDFINSAAATMGYGAGPGTAGGIIPNYYTGSLGPLPEDEKQVISHINLYHVYDGGNSMNITTFHRPRIHQLQLNDLDMVGADLNDMTCVFGYDSLYIRTDVPVNEDNSAALEQMNAAPIYPMRYNGPARAMQGPNNGGFAPTGGGMIPADQCSPEINTSTPGITTPPFVSQALDGLSTLQIPNLSTPPFVPSSTGSQRESAGSGIGSLANIFR